MKFRKKWFSNLSYTFHQSKHQSLPSILSQVSRFTEYIKPLHDIPKITIESPPHDKPSASHCEFPNGSREVINDKESPRIANPLTLLTDPQTMNSSAGVTLKNISLAPSHFPTATKFPHSNFSRRKVFKWKSLLDHPPPQSHEWIESKKFN